MNKFLLILAPALLIACSSDLQIDDSNGSRAGYGTSNNVDQPAANTPNNQGSDDVNTPYVPGTEVPTTSYSSQAAVFTSSMVTAGDLSSAEVEGQVTYFDGYLDYRFDAYTTTGWAMIQGSVSLGAELEDGLVIDMDDGYEIGCAGPERGQYDFDGPSDDGEITIEVTPEGATLLHFDFDYGSGGDMVGTAVLQADNF